MGGKGTPSRLYGLLNPIFIKTADKKLDTDNPEHIQWLYERALERAKEFNITGVTYSMTQGVVKNIIPAIASTNAIIAASCCNEAFKIATNTNPYLNNYMMYTGNESVYTYTFEHERKPDCPVCGNLSTKFEANGDWTLYEFIQRLKEKPDVYGHSKFLPDQVSETDLHVGKSRDPH